MNKYVVRRSDPETRPAAEARLKPMPLFGAESIDQVRQSRRNNENDVGSKGHFGAMPTGWIALPAFSWRGALSGILD